MYWPGAGGCRVESHWPQGTSISRMHIRSWDLEKCTTKSKEDGVKGARLYQFVRGGGHASGYCPCQVENLN